MDKLVFVGKNYLEHAKELGDAVPEKPVLFLKPPSVLKKAEKWGDTVVLDFPRDRGELHHECEIVLKISRGGSHLTIEQARESIAAVSLGLDMTLRTVQAQLKKDGHPWTIGKVFADAAVVGPEIPVKEFPEYLKTPFQFSLGESVRQNARGEQMMMGPHELLVFISQHFPLCEGDLVFTGTPAGVGPVHAGERGMLSWGGYSYQVEWR